MAFARKPKSVFQGKLSNFLQRVLILCLFSSLPASFQVNASTHETWPWLAYVPSLNCTGAIVHNRWLLTTTRCFQNKSIPSELFIQVRETSSAGKRVRLIYVIDYTRDDLLHSTHGFTMLYLARTSPSLTQNVVTMRANYANETREKTGIVLTWDTVRSNSDSGANGLNILALAVDVRPCVGDGDRYVCASFSKRFVSSASLAQYCSRLSVGNPLVVLGVSGVVTLAGVLHEKSVCQPHSDSLGKFARIDYGRKWIRRQFRIQGM